MKKIINYLNETIKKEKALLIFTTIMFIIGVIAGSLFINLVTDADKNLLINQVEVFFSSVKKLSPDVFGIDAFFGQTINSVLELFLIFTLGISMIGLPAVIIFLFLKVLWSERL